MYWDTFMHRYVRAFGAMYTENYATNFAYSYNDLLQISSESDNFNNSYKVSTQIDKNANTFPSTFRNALRYFCVSLGMR